MVLARRLENADESEARNPRFAIEKQESVCPTARTQLKKQPGEGTGPTMHADLRGSLVGRVPPRGEPAVFQQTARSATNLDGCNSYVDT